MAIRVHSAGGPDAVPEFRELLARRVRTIQGDCVMCPHCLREQQGRGRKNVGEVGCTECGEVFFAAKLGRKSYLTAKRPIDDDFLQE